MFLNKLVNSEQDDKKKEDYSEKIKRVVSFGYYTFNIAYFLSLIGFTLLAYKYMIDFIGRQIIVLFLPKIFMIITWILLVFYTIAKCPGKAIKELSTGNEKVSWNK